MNMFIKLQILLFCQSQQHEFYQYCFTLLKWKLIFSNCQYFHAHDTVSFISLKCDLKHYINNYDI